MEGLNIKELVKGNYCNFARYKHNVLYYQIELPVEVTDDPDKIKVVTLEFPVPLEDLKGAPVKAKEKAITLMRWIRKSMDDNTLIMVQIAGEL